jgi:solute carrier organic anion transporter family protein 1C
VALGIFSGGIVMKKFRLGICEATKLYLGSSVFGYLLFLSLFALGCENSSVAGLTVSYQGYVPSWHYLRRQNGLIQLSIEFSNKMMLMF